MRRYKLGKGIAVTVTAAVLAISGAMTAWAYAEKLETIEDNYWDEDQITIARWDEIEHATQYEVSLYRDESRVDTVKTKKESYNFKKLMTKEGEYMFRVRPLTKKSSYRDGSWSDYSESIYISPDYAEFLKNGGDRNDLQIGPGDPKQERVLADDVSVVYTAKWIPEGERWRYQKSDGTWQGPGWMQDPATQLWYYFGQDGYMMTGWIEVNGVRYYLQPSGAMVTGQHTIDGVVYQFDLSGAWIPS